MGVSRQSVSKWETGSSVPDLDKLVALSELFDVSLDTLVKDQVFITENRRMDFAQHWITQLGQDGLPHQSCIVYWRFMVILTVQRISASRVTGSQ